MGLEMLQMCKCCVCSEVAQVGTWTFQDSGSAKCVTRRGVGLPGNVATSVMLLVTPVQAIHPWVLLGTGRLLNRGTHVLLLRARGLGRFHRGMLGMDPLGAGVGPGLAGSDVGKKEEAGDFLQALSLLQSIVSPEDFAK